MDIELYKGEGRSRNIAISIVILAITLIRIWLAYLTPIYCIADAVYDDSLFVEHADTILSGIWLGDFNFRSIAKIPGFSIYIALCCYFGVPFNVALILTFMLAVIVTVLALRKVIDNWFFLIGLYVLLIFNPLMFDSQVAQRVYRSGVILSFAMMTVSSFIGLYINRGERLRVLIVWSVLCCFSFTCFYVMKEDSIWLIPFCVCVVACLFVSLFKHHKMKFSCLVLGTLPFICVFAAMNLIASVNQNCYGIYATSDRADSNYRLVIEDLNMIEDADYSDNQRIWVSREAFEKAFECSPTLSLIENEFNKRYQGQNYEKLDSCEGDLVNWNLKELVNDAGIYSEGGFEVEKFYLNVHNELEEAFTNGQLNVKQGVVISKMTPPLSEAEVGYTVMNTGKNVLDCIFLEPVYPSNYVASGSVEQQELFSQITRSPFAQQESQLSQYDTVIRFENLICEFYKVFMKILFTLATVALVLYLIMKIISHKGGHVLTINEELTIILIILGLSLSLVGNVAAVSMFMRWMEETRCLLLYTGCVAIFVPIIETLCIYLGYAAIRHHVSNFNSKGC